jgi:hypothetical protein
MVFWSYMLINFFSLIKSNEMHVACFGVKGAGAGVAGEQPLSGGPKHPKQGLLGCAHYDLCHC